MEVLLLSLLLAFFSIHDLHVGWVDFAYSSEFEVPKRRMTICRQMMKQIQLRLGSMIRFVLSIGFLIFWLSYGNCCPSFSYHFLSKWFSTLSLSWTQYYEEDSENSDGYESFWSVSSETDILYCNPSPLVKFKPRALASNWPCWKSRCESMFPPLPIIRRQVILAIVKQQ